MTVLEIKKGKCYAHPITHCIHYTRFLILKSLLVITKNNN